MAWHNLTQFQNVGGNNTLGDFIVGTSRIVAWPPHPDGGGVIITGFVICMIVMITFFAFLKSKGYSPQASYVAATWVSLLVALMLQPMGLIGGKLFIAVIFLAASSFIILFWFSN